MLLQQCMICEEQKINGIYLYTTFICEQCEHNMVHTDAREVKYRYYIEKLKNISERSLHQI